MRRIGACVLAACAVIAASGEPASAAVSGTNPCPAQASFAWMGDSVAAPVSIPSQERPFGTESYDGSILRPADTAAYPGPRPLAALAHGSGGNRCALFWAAQYLAGHGYVTMIWTATGPNQLQSIIKGVDAQRSAIAFARSAANPFAANTDGSRVAVVGYSLGAAVSELVQEDPDPGIKTLVAFDSLRQYRSGDPGGPSGCTDPVETPFVVRIPALGFAKDQPCDDRPTFVPPDLKLSGFLHWRAAGMASAGFVMRGFGHESFGNGGTEQQWHDLASLVEPWLDRWLLGDKSAPQLFFAESLNGRPTADILSERFASGVFLEPGVDSTDYGAYLRENAGPPETRKVRGLDQRVSRDQLRRHRVRVRLKSDQPDSSFECRVDKDAFVPCESGDALKQARLGDHTFSVRATDVSGLREKKPKTLRFEVVG